MSKKDLSLFDFPHFGVLAENFIGFDDLFGRMESALERGMDTSFPPYDIYTEDVVVENGKDAGTETHTFIKFALAGIPKDDLRVQFKDGILKVYTEKDEQKDPLPNNRKNIRLGIAQRSFCVTKTIDKSLEMVGAKYEDGCLYIEFKQKPAPKAEDLGMIEIQ